MNVFRKLLSRGSTEDLTMASSFASDASASLIPDHHPSISLRAKGEEMRPFVTSLLPQHDSDCVHSLSRELIQDWEALADDFRGEKVNLRSGADVVCYYKLSDRVAFFNVILTHLTQAVGLSSAFVQLLLITIRDVLNRLKGSIFARPTDLFTLSEHKEGLEKAAGEAETLFEMLQFCVINEKSRLIMSAEFVMLLHGFYKLLVDCLKQVPPYDLRVVDFLKMFYHVTQGVYAVGELLATHEGYFPYIAEMRFKLAQDLRDAILTIVSDPTLLNFSEEQFAFFSSSHNVCNQFSLHQTPYLDLGLILLVDFFNLTKGLNGLADLCVGMIFKQLQAILIAFDRYRSIDDRFPEVFCLFDKYIVILHLLKAISRQSRASACKLISEEVELFRTVMMNCCWYFVKWECPLFKLSFRDDEGRLGKLYRVLLDVCDCVVGSSADTLPLSFFKDLPVFVASDNMMGSEDSPGVLQAYTLELIYEYLKRLSESRARRVIIESELLSVLLTPFFQLVPTTLPHLPFDVAELPSALNLAEICNLYMSHILNLVLVNKEGKLLFLQEFIKGFQQYQRNMLYINRLSRLVNEMISGEDDEWVELLGEIHFVDYIFQVVMDSKELTEAPDTMKSLQVMITKILYNPKLAENLLGQDAIVRKTEELLHSTDFAEFSVEVLARLLACNCSKELYRRFVLKLSTEENEDLVKLLFQGIELTLSSPNKAKSQELFVKADLLKVILKRLKEFKSLRFCSIALPALRVVLQNCHLAKKAMELIGFKRLKTTLCSILDCSPRPLIYTKDVEDLIDNLLYILFESTDLTNFTNVKVPEVAGIIVQLVTQAGSEAMQLKYLEIFNAAVSKSRENAFELSLHGMTKALLRFFTVTQNKDCKGLTLQMLLVLCTEAFSPADLHVLIGLINDDTKATCPSHITSDLLNIVRTGTFVQTPNAGIPYFHMRRSSRIVTDLAFPQKRGFSVLLWVKIHLSNLDLEHTLLILSSTDRTKQFKLCVARNCSLSIVYTKNKAQKFKWETKLPQYETLNLVTVSYQCGNALTKSFDLTVSINAVGHTVTSGGKLHIGKNAFGRVEIGSNEEARGCEADIASVALFLTTINMSQVLEYYRFGPSCTGCFSEASFDYKNAPHSLPIPKLKEAMSELTLFLHPIYCLDDSRLINVVPRLYVNKRTELAKVMGTEESFRINTDSFLHPQIVNVEIKRKVDMIESLGCVGGVKLFFPLLTRINKTIYMKTVLNHVLYITIAACSQPSRWIREELSSGLLIETLQIVLAKLGKRQTLHTSTAELVLELKIRLKWNKEAQRKVVEMIILNPRIWSRSKSAVQRILVLSDHSQLYTSPAEKIVLMSRMMEFCLCASELDEGHQSSQKKKADEDLLKKIREVVESQIIESSSEDVCKALVNELLESILDYEPLHPFMMHFMLKLINYFAKRREVAVTDNLLYVMLHLLLKDQNGSLHCSQRVLRILKLTVIDSLSLDDCKKSTRCDLRDAFFSNAGAHSLINQALRLTLTTEEYHAVLSMIIHVPELSPQVSRSSFQFPDLPYKESFSSLITEHREVRLQFPQGLDLITSRLLYSGTDAIALEDLYHIAMRHSKEIFDRPNFPGWLLVIWPQLKNYLEPVSSGMEKVAIAVFGQGILHVSDSCVQLRTFLFSLKPLMLDWNDVILNFLLKLMTFLLPRVGHLEEFQPVVPNLHEFAYLLEDLFDTLHVIPEGTVVTSFIELLGTSKLMFCSYPSIPNLSIEKVFEMYNLQDRDTATRIKVREGGILRVALKLLFKSLRCANETSVPTLLTLLRRILDHFCGNPAKSGFYSDVLLMNKAAEAYKSSVFVSLKKIDDVLISPNFLVLFTFTELSDLIISRNLESEVVAITSHFLSELNAAYELMSILEEAAQGLTEEAQKCLVHFIYKFGIKSAAVDGVSAEMYETWTGWWNTDSFEVAKTKLLDKVTVVLAQAVATHSCVIERVLSTDDWMQSVHPYFIALTSRLIGLVDVLISRQPIPESKETGRALVDNSNINHINCEVANLLKKRELQKRSARHDYLYAKMEWKRFNKWQTREAGFWVKEQLQDVVWKLDPEFDLEQKCTRLKVMPRRKKSYYIDKAHKKTTPGLSRSATAKRRNSGCEIDRVDCRKMNFSTIAMDALECKFPELMLQKSPSTPVLDSPITPKSEDSSCMFDEKEKRFECERIQPKGASYGSLECSEKFLIFISANEMKGSDPKYLGGALVSRNSEMVRNRAEEDPGFEVGRHPRTLRPKIQPTVLRL